MSESKEFADAFFGGGTYCSVICDCGRLYFCNEDYGEWDTETTEYEELRALAEKDSKKYIMCDYTIRFGCLDGKTFVESCECGELRRYEDWIWERRHLILSYLTAKYEVQKKEINKLGENVRKVKGLE